MAFALPAIATAFQEGGMEKYNIEDIPSPFDHFSVLCLASNFHICIHYLRNFSSLL